jgi:hypothetical protein
MSDRGWFGDWDAPICRLTPKLPTPRNLLCSYCGIPFKDGDRGVILPLMHDGPASCAYHHNCFMNSILPPEKRLS